ncbi:MAG: hypothetical protein MSS69_02085 [Spirochaetales bacterium]|nr:hypothetical protein [Spirochaetales bacterium]
MKKIPTLFVRVFEDKHIKTITREVTTGMEWVLAGEGIATIKKDGSCSAIIDGLFYKRYDAKRGKKPPLGAIPCSDPDPVTGHWPHWIRVEESNTGDKWFLEAYKNSTDLTDGTYEAIGPHFQTNPYDLDKDILYRHGSEIVTVNRSFDDIRGYLRTHAIEGLVFWKDGEPQCKIKRSDFGFKWPVTKATLNEIIG